jgi:FAD-linked sulfhydryl oxidase
MAAESEDCKRAACRDMLAAAKALGIASDAGTSEPEPLDSSQLGRVTWTMLHSFAAHLPEQLDAPEARHMARLLELTSRLYPCPPCAAHMREYLARRPVAAATRQDVSQWLCDFHNEVNAATGKPSFDCAKAQRRWGPRRGENS